MTAAGAGLAANTVVKDISTGKTGAYVDESNGLVEIRPLTGGRRWLAPASYVRRATPLECAIAQALLLRRTAPIRHHRRPSR